MLAAVQPCPSTATSLPPSLPYHPCLQLKWYTVDVQYGGEVVGTGSGWERRWAEQAAARQALDNMGQLPFSPEEAAAPKHKAAAAPAAPDAVEQ